MERETATANVLFSLSISTLIYNILYIYFFLTGLEEKDVKRNIFLILRLRLNDRNLNEMRDKRTIIFLWFVSS